MPRTNYHRHSPSPPLFSPTPGPAHVPTHNSPQNQPPPPHPLSPTNSLTSFHSTDPQHEEPLPGSPELFSPTPASSTILNKWPSPPPLPQRSPRIRRHRQHNYESLASTNGSYDVCSSVGTPPPETPTTVCINTDSLFTSPAAVD